MDQTEAKIIDFQEMKAENSKKFFAEIAEEIRKGALQLHFGDNLMLSGKTEAILYYAIEGGKLYLGQDDYDERLLEAKQEILNNVEGIEEHLAKYPENDCEAVLESLEVIKNLAIKIKPSTYNS